MLDNFVLIPGISRFFALSDGYGKAVNRRRSSGP